MPPAANNDEQTKIALEALEKIASNIASNRNIHGPGGEDFDIRLDSWDVDARRPTDSQRMEPETIHQFFRDAHHLDYIVPVLDSLKTSVAILREHYKRNLIPITAKLSKGINSLPNEILVLIFEFAVPPGEPVKYSIWLSHVSRRFREVALRSPRLWRTLDGFANEEQLHEIIGRSGKDADLHVVLHGTLEQDKLVDFFEVCLPLASRWSSLTIISVDDAESMYTTDAILCDIFHFYEAPDLVFPRLSYLRLDQHRSAVLPGDETSWQEINPIRPEWSLPGLRVMDCDGYIPESHSSYATLGSLTMTFSLINEAYPEQLEDFRIFLGSLPSLTTLDLTIGTSVYEIQGLRLTDVVCSSLRSLALKFTTCIFPAGPESLICPFISTLCLPNLTEYSVSVELRLHDLRRQGGNPADIRTLGLTLLPGLKSRSKLTAVDFKILHTDDGKGDDVWRNPSDKGVTDFPLDAIPHVSTLSIQAFTGVNFSCVFYGQSSLRQLRLVDSDHLDIESLGRLVNNLRQWKMWGALESLVVERCRPNLEYEDVAKIVGKEKLVFVK